MWERGNNGGPTGGRLQMDLGVGGGWNSEEFEVTRAESGGGGIGAFYNPGGGPPAGGVIARSSAYVTHRRRSNSFPEYVSNFVTGDEEEVGFAGSLEGIDEEGEGLHADGGVGVGSGGSGMSGGVSGAASASGTGNRQQQLQGQGQSADGSNMGYMQQTGFQQKVSPQTPTNQQPHYQHHQHQPHQQPHPSYQQFGNPHQPQTNAHHHGHPQYPQQMNAGFGTPQSSGHPHQQQQHPHHQQQQQQHHSPGSSPFVSPAYGSQNSSPSGSDRMDEMQKQLMQFKQLQLDDRDDQSWETSSGGVGGPGPAMATSSSTPISGSANVPLVTASSLHAEGGKRPQCPEFSLNLQGLYPQELREEGIRFSVMYQVHFHKIFEEADCLRLEGIRDEVLSFWPKTRRFFALFQSPIVVHQILGIDAMFYEALANLLLPDPFRYLPPSLSAVIIEFSRLFPIWLHNATQFALPLSLTDAKIRAVKNFCVALHKKAIISNLGGRLNAQLKGGSSDTENKLQRSSSSSSAHTHGSGEHPLIKQEPSESTVGGRSASIDGGGSGPEGDSSMPVKRMLKDWLKVDFPFVAAQTAIFDAHRVLPNTLLQDITKLLASEAGVVEWSEWLHSSILSNHIFSPTSNQMPPSRSQSSLSGRREEIEQDAIHQFVLKWSFFTSNILQELTMMRADTMQQFRLLFEWIEAILCHHMELLWKNNDHHHSHHATGHAHTSPHASHAPHSPHSTPPLNHGHGSHSSVGHHPMNRAVPLSPLASHSSNVPPSHGMHSPPVYSQQSATAPQHMQVAQPDQSPQFEVAGGRVPMGSSMSPHGSPGPRSPHLPRGGAPPGQAAPSAHQFVPGTIPSGSGSVAGGPPSSFNPNRGTFYTPHAQPPAPQQPSASGISPLSYYNSAQPRPTSVAGGGMPNEAEMYGGSASSPNTGQYSAQPLRFQKAEQLQERPYRRHSSPPKYQPQRSPASSLPPSPLSHSQVSPQASPLQSASSSSGVSGMPSTMLGAQRQAHFQPMGPPTARPPSMSSGGPPYPIPTIPSGPSSMISTGPPPPSHMHNPHPPHSYLMHGGGSSPGSPSSPASSPGYHAPSSPLGNMTSAMSKLVSTAPASPMSNPATAIRHRQRSISTPLHTFSLANTKKREREPSHPMDEEVDEEVDDDEEEEEEEEVEIGKSASSSSSSSSHGMTGSPKPSMSPIKQALRSKLAPIKEEAAMDMVRNAANPSNSTNTNNGGLRVSLTRARAMSASGELSLAAATGNNGQPKTRDALSPKMSRSMPGSATASTGTATGDASVSAMMTGSGEMMTAVHSNIVSGSNNSNATSNFQSTWTKGRHGTNS